MAYTSASAPQEKGFVATLVGGLLSFGLIVLREFRVASRFDRIEALQALSDVELADRGLTRDQIVPYVFRDRMCM